MKSLHDLPKDMLIEIILNVKKQHEKRERKLLRECYGTSYNFCHEDDCDEFNIKTRDRFENVIYTTTDGNILTCYICKESSCEKHEKMFYCVNCEYSQCRRCCQRKRQCEICERWMCSNCNRTSRCGNCSLN